MVCVLRARIRQTFCAIINNDLNDVLSMFGYGEAFELSVSPSSFSYALTGNNNEIF